jgi:hypothetical protein
MTIDDTEVPTLDVLLQQLADSLAHERELGRQRMLDMGLDQREIDAALRYGRQMHDRQLAWAEAVALRAVGLVKLQ